jgi:hypothetical protein
MKSLALSLGIPIAVILVVYIGARLISTAWFKSKEDYIRRVKKDGKG